MRAAVLAEGDDDGSGVSVDEMLGAEPGRQQPGAGPLSVAQSVLSLVEAALNAGELQPDELPWLAELWLEDDAGDPAPAGDLALPGSLAASLLDPAEIGIVDPTLVERWGPGVLRAVGVLDGLALLRAHDVPLDPDAVAGAEGWPGDIDVDGERGAAASSGLIGLDEVRDLDGWDSWASAAVDALALAAGPDEPLGEAVLAELVAVRDLDAVRGDAWPRVLDLLASDTALRAAVTAPARAIGRGPGGAISVDLPSYSAWWLRQRLVGGLSWADPAATGGLAALLPPAPDVVAEADPLLRRVLGAVVTAADLDAGAVQGLLRALADPARELDAAMAVQVWAGLAELAGSGPELEPPQRVRVLDGAATRVVDASEAVVVDAPALLQRPDLGAPVVAATPEAAAALADLLDLPLASELARGHVEDGSATSAPVPPEVAVLLPAAPRSWCEHERLVVDGVDVDWWVQGAGPDAIVHACTLDGLARGLAWAGGGWQRRSVVAEALADASTLGRLVADEVFAAG